MGAFLFYMGLPFLYFFSILPMRLLYILGDYVLFPLLYYVLAYRKKVVRQNLNNAYPDLSYEGKLRIERDFYHFLIDLMLETLKNFTQSKKTLLKNISVNNHPKLDELIRNKQSFLVSTGHMGNYEWIAKSLPLHWDIQVKIPYRAFTNKYFDALITRARSKFGTQMFPTNFTARELIKSKQTPYALILANDQSAPAHKSYWTTFLKQDTSFFIGTEMLAREFDLPVFYALINRYERGKYRFETHLITLDAKNEPLGFIMEKHAQMLERDILANPSVWLWSHKRWKHKKPDRLDKGFSHLKKDAL